MNLKRKIFEFLVDHQSRWNCTPDRIDIQKAFSGLTDDVEMHLQQLEREDLIALGRGDDLSISFVPTFGPPVRVNIRGEIHDETSREAAFDGQLAIALDFKRIGVSMPVNGIDAIRACDSSMIDAGIAPGDIVILENRIPVRGDIVAVEIDRRWTLRRYLIVAGIPHLLAENSTRPDLRMAWDLSVNGVLWSHISFGSHHPLLGRGCGSNKLRSPVVKSESRTRSNARASHDVLHSPNGVKARSIGRANVPTRQSKKHSRTLGKGSAPSEWPSPPKGFQLNEDSSSQYKA